jgi:murein DD-endopeptidase MepM/ murein hydrolase activator NlpD
LHPILKIRRPHHGVDYAAATGTPVYALGDGRITHKGWDTKGGGNYIKIRHNSVYTTVYMHLSGFAKGIRKNMIVSQGQLIGYVGSTGLTKTAEPSIPSPLKHRR